MDCKKEYEILLSMGDLLELYPQLTGDWKKDKKEFTELCNQNKSLFE